jgi:hypothetical protein
MRTDALSLLSAADTVVPNFTYKTLGERPMAADPENDLGAEAHWVHIALLVKLVVQRNDSRSYE